MFCLSSYMYVLIIGFDLGDILGILWASTTTTTTTTTIASTTTATILICVKEDQNTQEECHRI